MESDDFGKAARRTQVRRRRLAVAVWALTTATFATPARAEPGPVESTQAFDIPSLPMPAALQAFSTTTGVEVLYESRIAAGRRSTAVTGRMTVSQALVVLLGDADIVARYAGAKAITLANRIEDPTRRPDGAAELKLDPLDVVGGAARTDAVLPRLFAQSLTADVQRRLNRDPRTRAGYYRAEIALWIDSARTVTRAALARTTGDAERDAAIVETLNGLIVARAAPPNAAQPVHLMITVRAN